MTMEVTDPATGKTLATYDTHDHDAVATRMARAWSAYTDWREVAIDERTALLTRLAETLETRRDELAALMVAEMGKPITAAEGEIDKCAWVCRYEAEHGPGHLAQEPIDTEVTSYVRFDPLGVVLAVMPWNFPFWQLMRAAVPAILAGNTVVMKHASNVPGTALAIEDVFRDAGAPEGVFTTLLIGGGDVAEVIADQRIRGVTLTGSVAAGRKVAATAGEYLKPTVMELGGSDPFIVLDDADVDAAAETAANARLVNSGQSCIAAKRFIVTDAVAERFVEGFVEHTRAATVGEPTDRDTDVGPMARSDLRDDLHDQVQRTLAQGAKLLTGGQPLDRDGFFYEPAILDEVTPEMPAAHEETFGPAAAVLRVHDEQEAVAVANASVFGLGASIWTTDLDRGQRVAADVESGMTFVNQLVKSDPRVPFGGVKDSGYGRELGPYGIRSFVNAKLVWAEG